MKKPRRGWPKYKKQKKYKKQNPQELDLSKLAKVFIIWGIIGLLTSYYFNTPTDKRTYSVLPINHAEKQKTEVAQHIIDKIQEDFPEIKKPEDKANIIGPIDIKSKGSVYYIEIIASLPVHSWSFIEGEVLNSEQEYLYSFGKELWHEAGRDSDGAWRENRNKYNMKATFPKKGQYYLSFKADSGASRFYNTQNTTPNSMTVTISQKRGSALPHFWFGLVLIIIGIIMHEGQTRMIGKAIHNMSDTDAEYKADSLTCYASLGFVLLMLALAIWGP